MSLEPVSTIHKPIEPTISLKLATSGQLSTNVQKSIEMPTIVKVAGAAIRPVQILPKKVQEFLDDATEGVIYFHLGASIKSMDVRGDKLKSFIETFSLLQQRVLWTYDDEVSFKLPANVLMSHPLPHNDILAHRNVVLFMTRSVISETETCLLHGVPMFMIPFRGDEYRTAIKGVVSGYAVMLQFSDVTPKMVLDKLTEILCDKRYGLCARNMSRMHRSRRLADSNDATMRWTHSRTQATTELPLHMDALGALFFVIIVVVKIITTLLRIFNYDDDNDKRKKLE